MGVSTEKPTTDNVIIQVLGTGTFDSLGEAYDLYNLYSWEERIWYKIWEKLVKCGEGEVHAGNCLPMFGGKLVWRTQGPFGVNAQR